jgi:hypothetical protein
LLIQRVFGVPIRRLGLETGAGIELEPGPELDVGLEPGAWPEPKAVLEPAGLEPAGPEVETGLGLLGIAVDAGRPGVPGAAEEAAAPAVPPECAQEGVVAGCGVCGAFQGVSGVVAEVPCDPVVLFAAQAGGVVLRAAPGISMRSVASGSQGVLLTGEAAPAFQVAAVGLPVLAVSAFQVVEAGLPVLAVSAFQVVEAGLPVLAVSALQVAAAGLPGAVGPGVQVAGAGLGELALQPPEAGLLGAAEP